MKVLQINCVFNRGSTGKITADLHRGMMEHGIDSVVCYGRGRLVKERYVYKICPEWYSKINNVFSRLTGIMYGGCFFSTNYLIAIIKKEKPDIVHLQCINGYFVNIYRLLDWLKKNGINTVLTLHAEFMYTGGCGSSIDCVQWKNPNGCGTSECPRWRRETRSLFADRTKSMWKKMKNAFDGFNRLKIIAVSNWIENRARISPILRSYDIETIYNGIRLDSFSSNVSEADDEVLHKYCIPERKKMVLHVTPSYENPVKGGEFFTKLAELLGNDYTCVVVGSKRQINEQIISIPFTTNQSELAVLYRRASVFVITSKADNYPTVCLEANCCGTPVVGFDVGGVKETICPGMGETVEFGDTERLRDATIKWANIKIAESDLNNCLKKNNCQRMCEDYIDLFNQIMGVEKNVKNSY